MRSLDRFHRPVVVGLTGTPFDTAAVHAAAAEALLRRREVHLLAGYGAVPVDTARRAMIDAFGWLHNAHPNLVTDARVLPGEPAGLLVERSRDAELTVVPAVPAAPYGTAATLGEQVAAHAWCPTLVAHPATAPGGDVVVALDGSPVPDPLLDHGFEAASLRGVPLCAVLVWSAMPATALGTLDPFAYDAVAAHRDADRLVAEALAGWSEKYPDVVVRRREVRAADPGRALLGISAGAGLVVVGAHGRSTGGGSALGAVTRRLIRHAHCPVVVIAPARPHD